MPMHVGDNHDRGGNDIQVRLFDRGTNMHSLWDSGMIERVGTKEDFWLTDLAALDTPASHQEAIKGTIPKSGDQHLDHGLTKSGSISFRNSSRSARMARSESVLAESRMAGPRKKPIAAAPFSQRNASAM